jgi:hypothetical protein
LKTIRTVEATRYLTPLREGGSLPAIVEADDDGLYVLKFRGAGQGPKALIAELVAGEIARTLGLPVPEIVFMQLDPELARTEPDPEIQDLIRASGGLNLGLDYLPGALAYDPLTMPMDSHLASRIVWFDALVGNVDRSARNTNMLWWHGQPWLIDHGASLVFQHQWDGYLERSRMPFAPIGDHVLLPRAGALAEADAQLAALLTSPCIASIVALIPDPWLDAPRDAYRAYFEARLQSPRAFAEQAEQVHARL